MNELALNIDETAARGAGPHRLACTDRGQRSECGLPQEPAWAAVGSMALGVFALVTAEDFCRQEFAHADRSLISGSAKGAAGANRDGDCRLRACYPAFSSRRSSETLTDRILMLGFTILLLISSTSSRLSLSSLPMLLIARVLLGAALGGFWTMSAALAMRLVPEASTVPQTEAPCRSIIFSGVSAATIFAAPVGIYLGHLFGWRAVFLMAAGLSGITLIAQALTLPRMPAAADRRGSRPR